MANKKQKPKQTKQTRQQKRTAWIVRIGALLLAALMLLSVFSVLIYR